MKKPVSPEARRAAIAIIWFIMIMIGLTIIGLWLKLFWFGWVMQ